MRKKRGKKPITGNLRQTKRNRGEWEREKKKRMEKEGKECGNVLKEDIHGEIENKLEKQVSSE